ncbi:protein-methionine-sulfoxide reductase catalytic subunit MsrP [Methylomonas sp. CM2]|uniref:protein-methionine-sulfoxide reductase catalytic subunit MsrP n=1 Tax=Methylomonas sp. CM2 TaxID=3417647 RepID=UPI003CE69751
MLIKTRSAFRDHDVTDPAVFQARRVLLKAMGLAAAAPWTLAAATEDRQSIADANAVTPARLVEQYNNYYELAFDKESVAQLARHIAVEPWQIEIAGEVEKPGVYSLEDILRDHPRQERIYRLRCVEGWSAVIPWLGFPLADLLKRAQPLSAARFVKFTSAAQPEAMPKLRAGAMLDWPYVEGLRLDEALHPLTILASGMYGRDLPKQNGAPLRLVVPWKYGFKSIKAIVKIELTRRAPLTSWSRYAPSEYGFYANVNPAVAHPRWTQTSERVLGSDFFTPRRKTELFNGYADQVGQLYSQMDLKHFF